MNVEASPSVTVSIFDALAEILTSTPRPRLSSTTEVTQKINTNNDVTQTFNGVSNINVNSVGNSTSQGTFMSTSADINTNAKTVQITDQTTPIVINHLSVGESVTPSLNTEKEKVDPLNTQRPIPTPTPTTPVSARRPFAFRVLYSDTESPKDNLATTPASIRPSTDSTVYNTVSDLLLSNNQVVSSELTSMLTNNIINILQNMDEKSRPRVTSDMADLLKALIPRAIDGLVTVGNDVDFVPSTTPYSLEDIKDTENIEINNRNDNSILNTNILQAVYGDNVVNSKISTIGANTTPPVNSFTTASNTLSVSSGQTTSASVKSTNVLLTTVEATTQARPQNLNIPYSTVFPSILNTDSVVETVENTGSSSAPSINNSNNFIRFPFLTNYRAEDFNFTDITSPGNSDNSADLQSLPLINTSNTSLNDVSNLDNDDQTQISKFQLWVLSKKARVLKMIEDLIRQHNDELVTAPPLTEIMDQTNNVPLSERLTVIMNNMGLTTETASVNNDGDLTTPVSFNFIPMSTSTQANTPVMRNGEDDNKALLEKIETTTSSTVQQSSNTTPLDFSLRFGDTENSRSNNTTAETVSTDKSETTTELVQSVTIDKSELNVVATTVNNNVNTESTTSQNNKGKTETTTNPMLTETTTQAGIDTTTNEDTEATTTADFESTTMSVEVVSDQTKQNITTTVGSGSVTNVPTIPKKDFVIFGILPNNTVVRKNPNDDILETLTEASPYIVYGVLPNNTVIRKFPNGTRVPRVMQKIDVLPISPWSLRNPYSPIHNNPAIVRPQSNPIRVSTNTVTSTDTSNNGTESRLTTDTVNNLQMMVLNFSCLA
jgi:hypothetical protein